MTNQIRVSVTADHISTGETGSARHCAIAKALQEQGYKNSWVSKVNFSLDNLVAFRLPKAAQKFVNLFDKNRENVKPSCFKFNISTSNKA